VVNLRVIRSRRSEPQDLSLKRTAPVPLVPSARLVREESGYLRIPNFDKGSAELARTKIKVLVSSGAKGLLVDLRSTADGNLDEAVTLADALLPVGSKISEIKNRHGETSVYASTSEPVVSGLPIVVLVDGGTSGPAEVLAVALKDNGLADTIGERSNGHGSIQHEFVLRSGARLFLSTGLMIRPTGKPLQSDEYRESGLDPDVQSPERDFISNFYFDNSTGDEDEELGDDFYSRLDSAINQRQFDAAVSHLQEKIRSQGNKIQRDAA
jgi:carboxyl-terminal processing protease